MPRNRLPSRRSPVSARQLSLIRGDRPVCRFFPSPRPVRCLQQWRGRLVALCDGAWLSSRVSFGMTWVQPPTAAPGFEETERKATNGVAGW